MAARPNFFIVGAPKCGTTALYEYLRSHPNIFMPRHKEPHYFARDLGSYSPFPTLDAYLALFAGSTDKHTRRGEASVFYLSSSVAIPLIHDFDPDAKLIAMLRNPVDLVQALHSQAFYVGEETVPDFEAAWRLQGVRSQGRELPPRCRDPFLFQFGQLACLGTHTQRLLAVFPARQVKLILWDDFSADAQRTYNEVIEFLDLPPDGRRDFPRINPGKRARITWLMHFLRKPPPLLRTGFHTLKQIVGTEGPDRLKRQLVKLNSVRETRPPLSPEFRAELVQHFRDEVALLCRLLNRDLSHWT